MTLKICPRLLNHCRFRGVRPRLIAVAKVSVPLIRLLMVPLVNLSSLFPLAAVAQESLDSDVAEVLDAVRDGRDEDAQEKNAGDDVDDQYRAFPCTFWRRYKVTHAPRCHRGVAVTRICEEIIEKWKQLSTALLQLSTALFMSIHLSSNNFE